MASQRSEAFYIWALALVFVFFGGPISLIVIIGLMAFYPQIWTSAGPLFGVKPLLSVGLGLVVGGGIIGVAILLNRLLPIETTPAGLSSLSKTFGVWPLFVFIVIWTPIAEELVYRGVLIGWGEKLFGPKRLWFLVLISTLIFMLGHGYQGAYGLILSFIAGLLLAGLYIFPKRNLLAPIIAHFTMNATAFWSHFH